MKICIACKKEKELECFNKNLSKKDGKQGRCKDCDRIRARDRYAQNKHKERILERRKERKQDKRLYIIEYLKNNPCVDCGESDPLVLEFDHTSDKLYSISELVSKKDASWKRINEEIKKCEIRCANCHRRKTAIQLNWNIVELLKLLK